MFVYHLLFAVILLGMVFHWLHFEKLSRFLSFTSIILILSIVGLRHETLGSDTERYLSFFLNPFSINEYYNYTNVEPVYLYVNLLINLFTDNKYVFLFIVTNLSLAPLLHLIWKYSNNKNLSLFLFISFSVGSSLFFLSYSMMRQFLAIGLFSILIDLYVANGYKVNKQILFVGVLMVFSHYSSIMVFVLFIIQKVQFSKLFLTISILFSAIIGYYIEDYMKMLMLFADSITYGFYFTSQDDTQYSIISKVPYLGIYFVLLFKCSKDFCNDFWMKGLFLAIFLSNFLSFGNNADRICAYFYVLSIISIPNGIDQINGKVIVTTLSIAILVYFTYKYYITFDIFEDSLYVLSPYKSCL